MNTYPRIVYGTRGPFADQPAQPALSLAELHRLRAERLRPWVITAWFLFGATVAYVVLRVMMERV